ncbi:hypothetical protein UFOVP1247_297 [uncultured Caudovirales phage]|uniref:Uncharacterized protein n=1 Tax=uncultured Caudovirales phage TaxID=2100421 RepID=A0A6J5Q2E1_9CAUD|nr:hypothetical protein UFOVP970_337 [uncultured Caudovirales phage]CAB4193926.1 hypothetical protein UFOVP1247_297 [uncultured Caudovirales phage]
MEVRIKSFSQFIGDGEISENLRYHIDNEYSLAESIFRPGSISHVKLLCEARKSFHAGFLELGQLDRYLFESTDLGLTGIYQGEVVPLDLPLEVLDLNEEKNPKLNYPQRGGAKKYHVYVKNTKTGRIMKIAFGDVHGGLTAKVSNPKARKSFAARHNCAEKKDRNKAGYWACRINRYAHLWGGKTYPGFW